MRQIFAVRSVAAAVVAIVYTFVQEHSASVGILGVQILAALMVLQSLVLGLAARDRKPWREAWLHAVVAAIAASVGWVFAGFGVTNLTTQLVAMVAIVTLGSAAIDLVRVNATLDHYKRERTMSAVLSLLAGLLYFGATLGLVRFDEVTAVGLFGAYLALTAVHFGIAATSPKP
ncbi:MAG: hypothetical protein RLZZ626_832 [Actinomycetota bacterium]